jgi:hypothetical protein
VWDIAATEGTPATVGILLKGRGMNNCNGMLLSAWIAAPTETPATAGTPTTAETTRAGMPATEDVISATARPTTAAETT